MRTLVGLVLVLGISSVQAAEIDRSIADFVAPQDIKWRRDPAGTNESAVLFGDPSKPGPYGAKDGEVVIQVWGMGPATSTPAEQK